MSNLREIVNGGLLAHNIGANVSIIGAVRSVNPNGNSFELLTSDDITVTVNTATPLDDMPEGYIEVHGKCQTRNSIMADEYIQFSKDQKTAGFDPEWYDKLCGILQQVQDVYKTG